jgi:hypothetical protein
VAVGVQLRRGAAGGAESVRVVEEARRAVVVALFAAAEIMPAENPFPSTFPTFVPNLSW